MTQAAKSEGERRILVAVDESEESAYALRWCLRNLVAPPAAGEAPATRDALILVYARPLPPLYSAMDGPGYFFGEEMTTTMEKYSRDLADSVMQKTKNICKESGHDKVETKVAVGDPRDVICQLVETLGADLLVMGSHGYGFIKRALLGSVSDHCARNAKCPVLIVKPREN